VVDAALQAAYPDGEKPRVVLLSPTGPLLDDAIADRLIAEPHFALLCGRYEGFDDRVHQHLADEELSIGRYVLAGGELPAMVVADVLMRKLPGALGHADSAVEESFSQVLEGMPEYPHFTRPPLYKGWDVPEILLSGDHQKVRQWRLQQSRARAEQFDLGAE
jgi:tRNA (guanine37-N1)-methyltransferase